ncbi:hypothetical protein [Thorsellia anophelis]|uniref:Uncharacterized protein n=1 Tax=Thorsellia anophelis DSM 18579 TaxID=1123402 RepID=A0A1H9YW99_9GAMM|nr:hypothetical protein [Thorsellia anophelis]SES72844.1 hypothetical protein SAMN02583745_00363 [Thorsellia anophelis DSM 18579]
MKKKLSFIFTILMGIYLATNVFSVNAALTPTSTISYPTYTLITDSIFSLVPNVGKKRDDSMMQLLCQIARDEITKESANKILTDKGFDIELIPETGHNVSLWINNDKAGQKAACAAYIATSLYLPQDNKEFLVKPDDPKSTDINKEKFAEVMRVRFSIADANAEIFSLIANNLDKNLTIEEYQAQISKMFTDLAPLFLDRIKTLYSAKAGAMTLVEINGDDYLVIDGEGRKLTFKQGQVDYSVHGVNWLGNGKILGKESFVDVYYFSQDNAPSEPIATEEVEEKPAPKKGKK